jgi:hypothetical protein
MTTIITVTPDGGSMWRIKGIDHPMTIHADRRPDGSVYVRERDDAAEDDGIAARNGVDPDDAESWDVNYDALRDALREFLGISDDDDIEIRII